MSDVCSFISSVSDEELATLLDSAVFGQNLWEHTATCPVCGDRAEQVQARWPVSVPAVTPYQRAIHAFSKTLAREIPPEMARNLARTGALLAVLEENRKRIGRLKGRLLRKLAVVFAGNGLAIGILYSAWQTIVLGRSFDRILSLEALALAVLSGIALEGLVLLPGWLSIRGLVTEIRDARSEARELQHESRRAGQE